MRRSARIRRLVSVTVAVLAAALVVPAAALAACPQTTLGEVESEVMCPVCGTPLALATEAPQAQEQREFILERIEECQSKDEIKAALVAEFGEEVLATPGGDGFDVLGYVLPGLAVVAGAGAVALAAVRWRRRRSAAAGVAAGPGDSLPSIGEEEEGVDRPGAEDARLEEDLNRYDL